MKTKSKQKQKTKQSKAKQSKTKQNKTKHKDKKQINQNSNFYNIIINSKKAAIYLQPIVRPTFHGNIVKYFIHYQDCIAITSSKCSKASIQHVRINLVVQKSEYEVIKY